jgi:hypothetical protein
MSIKLTKREKAELAGCKQSLTIVWKGPIPPRIDEIFFLWCRQMHNPYVHVSLRRTYADIVMDLPNGSGLLDTEGKDQFRALCVSHGCSEKWDCFENPAVTGVPREMAFEIAPFVVQIGLDFCRRNPVKHASKIGDFISASLS